MLEKNFIGKNGFIWWMGEIVNRLDPLGMGRCQVRIFGWHGDGSPESKANIPDADLPWAHAMFPVNCSKTFCAPCVGDWVVGFFFDGESGQSPCMMGVLPGFSQVTSNVGANTQVYGAIG